MAKAEVKTKMNDTDVAAFIASVENPIRRADAQALCELFGDVSGDTAQMWGPSIIGFGTYHYVYESGHEGDMCRTGFSPRKANMVIYLTGGYQNAATQEKMDGLRARLGKHKIGKSCLYINKLADIDLAVLSEMIRLDLDYMDKKYPG